MTLPISPEESPNGSHERDGTTKRIYLLSFLVWLWNHRANTVEKLKLVAFMGEECKLICADVELFVSDILCWRANSYWLYQGDCCAAILWNCNFSHLKYGCERAFALLVWCVIFGSGWSERVAVFDVAHKTCSAFIIEWKTNEFLSRIHPTIMTLPSETKRATKTHTWRADELAQKKRSDRERTSIVYALNGTIKIFILK